tara:strand:- start:357 stop:1040 length:684 start_codon:yes stop_codon:yes gene_type:complete
MSYIINTNNDIELSIDVDGVNYSVITSNLTGSCSLVPDNDLYDQNFAEVSELSTWGTQMALQQATYSDQEGVLGALILFAETKRLQAVGLNEFWKGKVLTCARRYNWITFHCNKRGETCNMSMSELQGAFQNTLTISALWTELKLSLQEQLAVVVENEAIYNTNQTLQAQFQALLASINVDIAESNLQVQEAENELLDLKQKELQSKAMYIIAPLLLLLGIALIFNK